MNYAVRAKGVKQAKFSITTGHLYILTEGRCSPPTGSEDIGNWQLLREREYGRLKEVAPTLLPMLQQIILYPSMDSARQTQQVLQRQKESIPGEVRIVGEQERNQREVSGVYACSKHIKCMHEVLEPKEKTISKI